MSYESSDSPASGPTPLYFLGDRPIPELLRTFLTALLLPLSTSPSFFSNLTNPKNTNPILMTVAASINTVGAYHPTVLEYTVPKRTGEIIDAPTAWKRAMAPNSLPASLDDGSRESMSEFAAGPAALPRVTRVDRRTKTGSEGPRARIQYGMISKSREARMRYRSRMAGRRDRKSVV